MHTSHSVDREGLMSEFSEFEVSRPPSSTTDRHAPPEPPLSLLMGVAKMTTPYQILKTSNLACDHD